MIDKKLIPYGGLKKEPFSGSHNGMRYFFCGDDGKNSTTFTVYIYPEPWCFEQTRKEKVLPSPSRMREWTRRSHGFSSAMTRKKTAGQPHSRT